MKILLICFLSWSVSAADIYVAQTTLGSGDGSSAANAQSIAWLNSTHTWTAGETDHLVGTISSELFPKSGTLNNPITILWEPGAKLSQPNGTLISCASQSNLVFDGGSGGIIENTATGTGLSFSNAQTLVDMSGAENITVKNLLLRNQYIHTNSSDSNPDIAACGGFYANGIGGTNCFLSCSFSNVGWCLNILATPAAMTVSNCFFINYDHAIVPGGTNIGILNNHFDTAANWDTTANAFHHDPIHYFGGASVPTSLVIAGNTFTNNLGSNNTADIFLETAPRNTSIFNNVFLQFPGNYLNDGMIVCGGDNSKILNNTFVGTTGILLSSCLTVAGTNVVVVNNLFNSFNNFISQVAGSVTYSNNLYANLAGGGNPPWATNGFAATSFADWQAHVGDSNSIYTNVAIVNADGTIPSGSVAVDRGANLTSLFATDIKGNTRPVSGAWDIGAYAITRNGGNGQQQSQPIIYFPARL